MNTKVSEENIYVRRVLFEKHSTKLKIQLANKRKIESVKILDFNKEVFLIYRCLLLVRRLNYIIYEIFDRLHNKNTAPCFRFL